MPAYSDENVSAKVVKIIQSYVGIINKMVWRKKLGLDNGKRRHMKKICIVSFCNLYVLPYGKTYVEVAMKSGADCTLLFWDRSPENDERDVFPGCRKLCYRRKLTAESSVKDKLFGYIAAIRYFRRVLKKGGFDGVIFLQTHAAVACGKILCKNYRKRYIVDIRDYTLENFKCYQKREKKVIASSFATVISSPAYSRFLPEHEYIVAHNYTPFPSDMVKNIRQNTKKRTDAPIRISFVGTIRFLTMDKKILCLLANDERFQINYFGAGAEILQKFCEEKGIRNARFHGGFLPEKTIEFYEQTDIINNLYGSNNKFLDYALSNKLYHAAQLHMPILVCPGTYMEEITARYNMGVVMDVDNKKEPDRLFEWYSSLDWEILSLGCDRFIEWAERDNKKFMKMIADFIAQ